MLQHKKEVFLSLPHASPEVREPFCPIRHIDPDVVSFLCQPFLQVSPDAIEHLKFKPLLRDAMLLDEGAGIINNRFIMRRDGNEPSSAEKEMHHLHIAGVGVLL